jgi:hypothetical protein
MPVGSRKRRYSSDDGGGGEDARSDESTTESHKRLRLGSEKKTSLLACPFWKRDPLHHMDCLGFNLKRLKDVKQHLQRKHYEPECSICRLDLENTTKSDNHVQGSCAGAESVGFTERIRPEQQKRLQAIVSRAGSSEADTWVQIWHILFKNAPLPPSPYQKTIIGEAADVIKTIWARHEIEITRAIGAELPSSQALLRQSLPAILSKALQRLFEKLETAISSASGSEVVSFKGHGQTSFNASIASGGVAFSPPAFLFPEKDYIWSSDFGAQTDSSANFTSLPDGPDSQGDASHNFLDSRFIMQDTSYNGTWCSNEVFPDFDQFLTDDLLCQSQPLWVEEKPSLDVDSFPKITHLLDEIHYEY